MNIKYKKITDTSTDCTTWYEIQIEGIEKINIYQFITYILKENKNELGSFNLNNQNKNVCDFTNLRVKYKYGEIIDGEDIFNKYKNKIISKIHANCGWSNSTYYIKFTD